MGKCILNLFLFLYTVLRIGARVDLVVVEVLSNYEGFGNFWSATNFVVC